MPMVGDVKCYHCGFISGELVGQEGQSLKTGEFRPAASITPHEVGNQPIRCARCGGPVYLDDVRFVRVRPPTSVERGRPGRPRRDRQPALVRAK